MLDDSILKIFFFVFGGMIGSFLNVCIVRMPQEKSVVAPRSHCPACKKTIPWFDNIPFLSYLILRGKCRFCGQGFSPRYLLVEFVTALFFLFFYLYFGLSWVLIPYLVLVSGLIVATFIDIEHRIIPDEISLGGMVVGVIFSLFIPQLHLAYMDSLSPGRIFSNILVGGFILYFLGQIIFKKKPAPETKKETPEDEEDDGTAVFWVIVVIAAVEFILHYFLIQRFPSGLEPFRPHLTSLDSSLIGLLVGGGSIYTMGLFGNFLFKKETMGGGDVKLMGMLGAFLGWQNALLAFFIAPFFGAIVGVIIKIRTKDSMIAYGPFLALGALISLFYGPAIIQWLLYRYGITS